MDGGRKKGIHQQAAELSTFDIVGRSKQEAEEAIWKEHEKRLKEIEEQRRGLEVSSEEPMGADWGGIAPKPNSRMHFSEHCSYADVTYQIIQIYIIPHVETFFWHGTC